jgi:hypothetical protein
MASESMPAANCSIARERSLRSSATNPVGGDCNCDGRRVPVVIRNVLGANGADDGGAAVVALRSESGVEGGKP